MVTTYGNHPSPRADVASQRYPQETRQGWTRRRAEDTQGVRRPRQRAPRRKHPHRTGHKRGRRREGRLERCLETSPKNKGNPGICGGGTERGWKKAGGLGRNNSTPGTRVRQDKGSKEGGPVFWQPIPRSHPTSHHRFFTVISKTYLQLNFAGFPLRFLPLPRPPPAF